MGYYGKIEEKHKAQALRKKGSSYNEILLKVKVSKDTLSRWCRDIRLTYKQEKRLISKKKLGQRKGSLVAADNKRKTRLFKMIKLFKEAKNELGSLSNRDRFIAGIALYAGEGTKTDGQGGFSNSNPQLIKFMSKWFQKFCNLDKNKLRGALWLHKASVEDKAIDYWSRISGIPNKQFYKTYITKRNSKHKIRKNIHKYGVLSIRFNDSDKQRKIMGWISALSGGKIPS